MTTVDEWSLLFNNKELSIDFLKKDYGIDYFNFEFKRKSILNLLNLHKRKFGNDNIIIVRAPGRINLMGRHIDHQGGNVNLIAIDKEIFITASLRDDLKIIAYNIDQALFGKTFLNFSKLNSEIQGEWIEVINNKNFLKRFRSLKGNWDNYIKASYLRLINLYGNDKIFGANICVSGNILIAAGLSSSSALIVGIFLALSKLNKIKFKDEEIINLCAEAEWFVGTRGGSADHVAIKLARNDQIAHVKLFNLEILEWLRFPQNCELLICNTNIIAHKSGNKRDLFNEKVLAYEIGLNLIKKKYPQYTNRIKYLRDINPENLGIKSEEIYKILLEIPEYINYDNLSKFLGNYSELLKNKYQFITIPKKIPIRKVIGYGVSECERSKNFSKFIKSGDLKQIGRFMSISHNGDRIIKYNSKLEETFYNNEVTDDLLYDIIQKKLDLSQISGGYGCSIPEIDFIVDLSVKSDGVYGAQLSGAGLGGCVMILIKKGYSEIIIKLIKEKYKKKFGEECSIDLCKPVKGSSLYCEF